MIDTALASDNPLRFRKNVLERIQKIAMTIDDKIRNEKLQCKTSREAAKKSALSSDKIDKYEYLIDEEILPADQSRVIEQATFTYSPLGKAFEKQIKTIGSQGENQIKESKDLKQLVVTTALIKKCYYDDEKDSPSLSKQK